MVEETPPDPGFTVVDKRGRRAEASAPSADAPRPESSADETAAARETPQAPGGPAFVGSPVSGPSPGPDLPSFLLMLYGEALIHLGEAPDPITGQTHQDLAQAKYTIDLLDLLKAKTEGNRTPEESGILEEILYALRVHYLRVVRVM